MKQQKKYRDSEVERNTNHTKSNEETQNGDLQRPNRTMLTIFKTKENVYILNQVQKQFP
jgi:hypothetical protein